MARNPGPASGGSDHSSAAGSPSGPLTPMEATLTCLWWLTPFTATISVLVVIIAMFTNQWLHTEEKMNNPSYNGTGEKDYLSKLTTSGLWMLCFTNPGETLYDCNKIDYFSKEEYSPDPSDSTMVIPYTVTRSMIFFLVSTLLLFGGYGCCMFGQCIRHRTFCIFVSGVIFILSGLVMLFGLIMYISVFKAEIGSKLRPRSQLQPPAFEYWYGYSFVLYVGGLLTTKLTGICSIFLFIYKAQHDWHQTFLEDRLLLMKKGHHPNSHKNHRPLFPNSLTSESLNNSLHFDHTMFYPSMTACRRHHPPPPHAYVNSNSAILNAAPIQQHGGGGSAAIFQHPSPVLRQKRYFFSKDQDGGHQSPCSLHPQQQDRNLLFQDGDGGSISNFYDFPPPPTISYQFEEQLLLERSRCFPRDVTTNTISTTADVVTCTTDDVIMTDVMMFPSAADPFGDYSPANSNSIHRDEQRERDFVTFDLDQPLSLRSRTQSVVSIGPPGPPTISSRNNSLPPLAPNNNSNAVATLAQSSSARKPPAPPLPYGSGSEAIVTCSDTLRRTTPV